MLRSEEMTLCQLIERNEMARIVVTELGEAGLVQFRDMNGDTPVYKRPFSEELKRCDDMSRKVTWLFNQLENVGLPAPEYDLPEDGVEMLPGLDAVEDALKAAKTELEASRTQELLVRKAHNALKEHIHVLKVGGQLFEEGRIILSKRRKGRPPRVPRPEDVLPESGLLVIFDSKSLWHEVLPTSSHRLCLVGWFLHEA